MTTAVVGWLAVALLVLAIVALLACLPLAGPGSQRCPRCGRPGYTVGGDCWCRRS